MQVDQIEKSLQELADRLQAIWQGTPDATSPLAEVAALARAVLILYREQGARPSDTIRTDRSHWSYHWEREHGHGDHA